MKKKKRIKCFPYKYHPAPPTTSLYPQSIEINSEFNSSGTSWMEEGGGTLCWTRSPETQNTKSELVLFGGDSRSSAAFYFEI